MQGRRLASVSPSPKSSAGLNRKTHQRQGENTWGRARRSKQDRRRRIRAVLEDETITMVEETIQICTWSALQHIVVTRLKALLLVKTLLPKRSSGDPLPKPLGTMITLSEAALNLPKRLATLPAAKRRSSVSACSFGARRALGG